MARKTVRRPRPPKTPLGQRLRGNFLTGLVVVLPVFLTIYLVWVIVGIVDARVIPLIPRQYNPENVFGRNIFGLGLVMFVVFTTLVGAMTKGYVGARIIRAGEGLVDRTPIIRRIYNALKQIAETVFSQTNTSFQQACLVEHPRKGCWRVAFVAGPTRGEVAAQLGGEFVSVFVPNTPNPTAGFLIFVPRAEVLMLEMSIEDAAKVVISGGMVTPGDPRVSGPLPAAPARRTAARQG
ncbi:DUF502 domain-containing protein [Amaricoccus sp.]|uniref:DUF502 domain-containing protein n=1 Tax=Amaricoccus sp. TaxID=1872485 RepID=UPI001B49663E|nr:DUF502 domain-containing protein [Amaricoccus sp.]MBP7000862.1 DUF502 domain-containing protein [Amaricoccus sp.]